MQCTAINDIIYQVRFVASHDPEVLIFSPVMEPEYIVDVAIFVLLLQIALRRNILLAAINNKLKLLIQSYLHHGSESRFI